MAFAESGVEGRMCITGNGVSLRPIRVSNWTIDFNPVLQEDTNAETEGQAHRAPVKKDYKMNGTAFVFPGEQPEQVGFIDGTEVAMYLRVGKLLAYNNWVFILSTVTLRGCDANGLVSYDFEAFAQKPRPVLAAWAGPAASLGG